mmetsp:Transcript_51918/g.121493  ORF Transcript_51918/g.121493 Transcript_51918/m.121493 type:complete len:400 (-) Transcript_51918:1-1200(-)
MQLLLVAIGVLFFWVSPSHADGSTPKWEALVINMDKRHDRLERFAQTLQANEPWLLQDGRTCRVHGRDGSTISLPTASGAFLQPRVDVPLEVHEANLLLHDGWMSKEAISQASDPESRWPNMTTGGMGLYLGHAAAWKHVVDKGLDYALVMEDDLLLFSQAFHEEVSDLLSKVPIVPWHLLYLQRCDDPLWMKERTWWQDGEASNRIEFEKSMLVMMDPGRTVTCTGAYIITKAGAEVLLEHSFPATYQLDYQLGHVPGLARAAMSPPLAQCQEIFKDSHGTRKRDTDVQQYEAAKLVAHPPVIYSTGWTPSRRSPLLSSSDLYTKPVAQDRAPAGLVHNGLFGARAQATESAYAASTSAAAVDGLHKAVDSARQFLSGRTKSAVAPQQQQTPRIPDCA